VEERWLRDRIKEVSDKKGVVDPAVVVCRERNKPIQLIIRSVAAPVAVGDYVSVSVT
jgi:hypothetical protein